MSSKWYTEEFKIEAVKQVTDRGHSVADVAAWLEVSVHNLYAWIKHYSLTLQYLMAGLPMPKPSHVCSEPENY